MLCYLTKSSKNGRASLGFSLFNVLIRSLWLMNMESRRIMLELLPAPAKQITNIKHITK